MGLDTFAPMLRWQPEMKGNLPRVVLSTTVVGGQTFVPSAHRGEVDDQRRDACRRVTFVCSRLYPVVGESVRVGADVVAAEFVEVKDVSGKLAVERLFHLAFSNVLTVAGSDDVARVNDDAHVGDASSPASGLDFKYLIIGCHLRPPDNLRSIIGPAGSVSTDIIAIESKDKHMPGKFAVQRRFNLMRLNKIPISGSNEDVRIEKDSNRGGASPLALGLDFVCLAIELCHFWLSCLFVKMIIAYNNKAVEKNRETLRSGYGRGLFGQGD